MPALPKILRSIQAFPVAASELTANIIPVLKNSPAASAALCDAVCDLFYFANSQIGGFYSLGSWFGTVKPEITSIGHIHGVDVNALLFGSLLALTGIILKGAYSRDYDKDQDKKGAASWIVHKFCQGAELVTFKNFSFVSNSRYDSFMKEHGVIVSEFFMLMNPVCFCIQAALQFSMLGTPAALLAGLFGFCLITGFACLLLKDRYGHEAFGKIASASFMTATATNIVLGVVTAAPFQVLAATAAWCGNNVARSYMYSQNNPTSPEPA
jgi:hypothetical protein